jgi:hypothetical protein
LAFLLKIFGKKAEFFYAISAIIEAGIWLIYPIKAQLSMHSCMAYMGGVIILCFHLQLTKVKYVYAYFLSILAAMIYLGDFEFATIVLGHVLIACILTIETIRYRNTSKKLNLENEEIQARLHNKNYFSHHLFNPLTIIKGMISSESLPKEKVKSSILNCLDRMNGVISQFTYSQEHVVKRSGDDQIAIKKNRTLAINIKVSIFIIFLLYTLNLAYHLSHFGASLKLLPSIGIMVLSLVFFYKIQLKYKKEELLSFLVYFLFSYEFLMGLDYLVSTRTNYSLGLLLAGLIFALSMSIIDSIKVILSLFFFSILVSLVIWDWLNILMFVSFIIYFLKVVLGSKSISMKLEERENLNKRIKYMYEEYLRKADILIPTFNQLDRSLRNFVNDFEFATDEVRESIDEQIDDLISQVKSDNLEKIE